MRTLALNCQPQFFRAIFSKMTSAVAKEDDFSLPTLEFGNLDAREESSDDDSDDENTQSTIKKRVSKSQLRKSELASKYYEIPCSKKLLYYFMCVGLGIVPFFAYGSLFTQIGWGLQVLAYLKSASSLSKYFMSAGLLVLFLLYLFDFSYFKGWWKTLKNFFLLISCTFMIFGLWAQASSSPQLPLFLFYMFVPIYYALCKTTLFKKVHEAHFLSAVAGAYATAGVVCLCVWLVWQSQYAGGSGYTAARLELNRRLGCTPHIEYTVEKEYEYCINPAPVGTVGLLEDAPRYLPVNGTAFKKSDCKKWKKLTGDDVKCQLGSFLIFYGMLGTGFVAMFFGAICQTLSYLLAGGDAKGGRLIKIFGFLLGISLLGMYLGSALTMADSGVSDLVVTFSVFGIISTTFFLAASLGWSSLEKDLMENESVKAMAGYDSIKGLGVLFFTVPYFFFFIISCINQFFRKHIPCAYDFSIDGDGKLMEAEKEKQLHTTLIFHNQWKLIRQWHIAYVLTWTMVWAMIGFSINILIPKFVYVVLSMLSDWMQNNLEFGWVLIVFYFVGLLMFLNPAIPGIPVYLVGGVVITRVGESIIGFWNASALVCAICFVLKLNAVVVQQKVFGERMAGTRIWIRALIAVNSPTTRAIKKILQVPGLSIAKMAVLCGGPDWPTSVTTGILGCDWKQMVLGTCPIICMIVPTVMTGAFKNKEAEGALYQTLSGLFMSGTTVVQSGAGMLAMYYISKTTKDHYEELSRRDASFDEEVDKLDKLNALKNLTRKEVTEWSNISCLMKANLICGAVTSMLYTYLFFGGTSTGLPGISNPCFKDFQLSDSVSTTLNGDPLEIINFNGYVGLAIFCISFGNYKIYNLYARKLVETEVARLKELELVEK